MVCIPCIVIPVLLWVYKKFLEPIVYPFIAPFINRIWPQKAVPPGTTASKPDQSEKNGTCKSTVPSKEVTDGSSGPADVSNKKMD
ncbi:UPF0729 protein C18orf32 homolog [Protopterus annectens]|uniref:UPF0729 protein C18orf32 homolog n=1 Tax=Protopterus annectens TaxID=7888 RepID=UPI001CF9FFCC|nr:UPF0729 protein C18orf32 homolog [Protopterus annectens]